MSARVCESCGDGDAVDFRRGLHVCEACSRAIDESTPKPDRPSLAKAREGAIEASLRRARTGGSR